jgi:hypothetical protein
MGLGVTLRWYQHDRLGNITTATHSATPGAQIIRIYRGRHSIAPGGRVLHSGQSAAATSEWKLSDPSI